MKILIYSSLRKQGTLIWDRNYQAIIVCIHLNRCITIGLLIEENNTYIYIWKAHLMYTIQVISINFLGSMFMTIILSTSHLYVCYLKGLCDLHLSRKNIKEITFLKFWLLYHKKLSICNIVYIYIFWQIKVIQIWACMTQNSILDWKTQK